MCELGAEYSRQTGRLACLKEQLVNLVVRSV